MKITLAGSFLFKRIQVPIYGKLAAALIKSKFEEHSIRHVEIRNILDETEVEFQQRKYDFTEQHIVFLTHLV